MRIAENYATIPPRPLQILFQIHHINKLYVPLKNGVVEITVVFVEIGNEFYQHPTDTGQSYLPARSPTATGQETFLY